MASLGETMTRFVAECNANERLKAMNQDWDRLVVVRADDAGEEHWVAYRGGVAALTPPAGDPDLVVEGPGDVLCDVFSGAIAPTEPYMNGDLRVQGTQDDIMRLDIITLLIWGE